MLLRWGAPPGLQMAADSARSFSQLGEYFFFPFLLFLLSGAFPGALGAASRSAAHRTVLPWTALPLRWPDAIAGQAVAAPASGIAGVLLLWPPPFPRWPGAIGGQAIEAPASGIAGASFDARGAARLGRRRRRAGGLLWSPSRHPLAPPASG